MTTEYSAQPATKEDLTRVERQIADLALAIRDMILLGERQRTQGERIGALEQDMAKINEKHANLDTKVAAWINRLLGAQFIIVVLWGVVRYLGGKA